MKIKIYIPILTIMLLLFSSISISQTLELGTLSTFEAYTGKGAVTGPGASGRVTGDVGTNDGIITGFSEPPSTYSGTEYNNDPTTIQARIDLLRIYIHLSDVFVTHPTGGVNAHAPAFGGGETITPGVYSIEGAGSVAGTLTLDGGGNPNAFFILKFEGEFTAGAASNIVLSNGTRAANVYWIAEGAIEIGANSVIKGTLFSHPGAITLGANCNIEGRLFSSEGAIVIAASSVAEIPAGPITIPINCEGNCSAAPAVDVLGSIAKFALFTSDGAVSNAATSGFVGDIGSNTGGSITGLGTSPHVGTVYMADAVTAQAKIDLDTAYAALMALPNTELGHAPAFGQAPSVGTGEVVTAGVYYIGGAGSISGTVVLDGENDPDAIFVFKFNGAFSVAAQSKVILTNGARRCNVFWISEGAASMGTFTVMKGTVLAHAGACSMGANGNLEGRMLSTAGAVTFSTGVIYNDTLCFGDDTPISGGNQTICSDETTTQTLTATATSNTTNGSIIWYDAATAGNVVSSPTQVGIGTVTYYAASFNGTYASETRAAVTLTIENCRIIIAAIDDHFSPILEIGGKTSSVLVNDTLNGSLLDVLEVALTPGTAPIPVSGNITMNADGTIAIAAGTSSGTYTYPYTICENADLSNCNTAIATVIIADGIPMITQVYQFNDEKWIEITNVHPTKSIAPNLINIQLYKNKIGDQTEVVPDVTYLITTPLAPGKSVLIKNATNVITNLDANATVVTNNTLTDFTGNNHIITLSSTNGANSYASRYDVVASFTNKTSLVRIDEALIPNKNYTTNEWIQFIDPSLNAYRLLVAGGPERHPHAPLTSEIINSNSTANTLLGLHNINTTTRTGNTWSNGFPDRSRHVIIDENYNHTGSKLSARRLVVDNNSKFAITDNLLVVTDEVILTNTTDEIRLIGTSQLIQTHTGPAKVSGNGRLLVDQNSTVPSRYRFNYMSSPVNTIGASTFTLQSVLKDGTTAVDATSSIGTIAKEIAYIGGYDGATTDPISLADHWVYSYAPSDDGRSNWLQKKKNGKIDKGDGFTFKGPGRPQNYTFSGTPNDGTFNTITAIGANESYLIGNPFPSAMSVKNFIEDNVDATSATLYFWQHVSEENTTGNSSGHNFNGYVGGYATRNIAMGVTANDPGQNTPVNFVLEAEDASTVDGAIIQDDTQIVVAMSGTNNAIKFTNISRGIDTLRIRYKSSFNKRIKVKINSGNAGTYVLPATNGRYYEGNIILCIKIGSDITFTSNDTNVMYLDNVRFKDHDGEIGCTPSTGGETHDDAYIAPESYIAMGQGFFIQGDNIDGGPIVFKNSQREYKVEGNGSSIFLKSEKSKSNTTSEFKLPLIKLGMNFTDNEGSQLRRQIGASFHQGNSYAFDKGYDSEMNDLNTTDIYWKFPNNELPYVIAGVQEITNSLEVPLEIIMAYNGSIYIVIDEIEYIDQDIFIKDKLTGETQQINTTSATYQLEEGTYKNRFVLAFGQSKVLANEDLNPLETTIKIYADTKNKSIVISKNAALQIKNAALYNILGKKINFWTIKEEKNTYQFVLKGKISTGVYVVKLNTNDGVINKKIIIE
ncbi:ice-binding family protein [Polaribacter sp. IC073]|uniref:ice-binding family protein n=1 Tax=Polaribacter sp. IC073 TaxID=2508540 RepID=UPI0011BE3626|nr:ice-binding family protein [Polaribacter sp. IC073]TXD47638.1 DUF3494 domain-containing protein [Polaribacter sp. IC073]